MIIHYKEAVYTHIHTHVISCNTRWVTWAAGPPIFKSPGTNVELLFHKLPILLNTFLVFPHIPRPIPLLSFACTVPPSPCSPGYYLIMLKVSQKPGFRPKVLNRGHNLADMDCGMFGSVFPGLLYTEWLKGSQGCIRCSVQEQISVMVTQIIPEMSRTDSKMKNVDKGQTCEQASTRIQQDKMIGGHWWLLFALHVKKNICVTMTKQSDIYNQHMTCPHPKKKKKKKKGGNRNWVEAKEAYYSSYNICTKLPMWAKYRQQEKD